MKIALLAVGNEILTGKTINTNAAYLAKQIEQIGGKLTYQQVVGDELDEIVDALKKAYQKADFVITIGGLGPTVDDLTRNGVAKYFNVPLVFDESIYESICAYFKRMNKAVPDNNKQQAYRFEKSNVLTNHNGTAPGLFYEQDERTIILLPGPPHELQALYLESVEPYLRSLITDRKISRSYRLCGIGESYAEQKILSLYDKYPMLNIAPYCTISHVDYIVTTAQSNETKLDEFEVDFTAILNDHIIGSQNSTLAELIVKQLAKEKMTLATAESCSGGLLASSFVDIVGSSSVFLEGIVTYSYESKMNRLNIEKEKLLKYGAVSAEIATDMAKNLKNQTKCDLSVAITGIAGPGGGSKEKPVGLVYIAININDDISVHSYIFNGNREKIRQQTVAAAQYLIFKIIKAL